MTVEGGGTWTDKARSTPGVKPKLMSTAGQGGKLWVLYDVVHRIKVGELRQVIIEAERLVLYLLSGQEERKVSECA